MLWGNPCRFESDLGYQSFLDISNYVTLLDYDPTRACRLIRHIPVAHPAGSQRLSNFAPGKIVESDLGYQTFL
jgi:hypothetical protein